MTSYRGFIAVCQNWFYSEGWDSIEHTVNDTAELICFKCVTGFERTVKKVVISWWGRVEQHDRWQQVDKRQQQSRSMKVQCNWQKIQSHHRALMEATCCKEPATRMWTCWRGNEKLVLEQTYSEYRCLVSRWKGVKEHLLCEWTQRN